MRMRRESRIAGLAGLAGIVCLLLQTLDPEVLLAERQRGLGIKLGVI